MLRATLRCAEQSLNKPSVRRMVRTINQDTQEQRKKVVECSDEAAKLTATAARAGAADRLYCFEEVATGEEAVRSFVANGAMSGVAVAVSDCLDVCGFQTRYGVNASMFHRAPKEEFPLVGWLRTHGAHFVGKLRCHSPLCLEEGIVTNPHFSVPFAVAHKACHYAITNSLIGPAGLMAPLHHPVAAFKPTSMSFASPGIVSAHSLGVVANKLDDLLYLWQVYTAVINASTVAAEGRKFTTASSSSSSSDVNDAGKKKKKSAAAQMSDTSEPMVELTVGYPGEWIDRCCGGLELEAHGDGANDLSSNSGGMLSSAGSSEFVSGATAATSASISVGDGAAGGARSGRNYIRSSKQFASNLTALIEKTISSTSSDNRKKKMHKKVVLLNMTFDFELELVMKITSIISSYELARSIDAFFSSIVRDGKTSAFLEQLPPQVISSVFRGRKVSDVEYHEAIRARERVLHSIEEQFRDVDIICAPLTCEPYQDGNMRTIALTLPFALSGNPMISLPFENDGPAVQLVGELGRDTGLLEDATTFSSFVHGSPPRWWRRRFFGDEE